MPRSKKWSEDVTSEQGFATWAYFIVSVVASVLIFLAVPPELADEGDNNFKKLRDTYIEQDREVTHTVQQAQYASNGLGLPAAAGSLVNSLDWRKEGEWKNRRAAVQQLGAFTPANEQEYKALAYWIGWSTDWHNEGDEDVRKAAVEALGTLNTNWNKVKH